MSRYSIKQDAGHAMIIDNSLASGSPERIVFALIPSSTVEACADCINHLRQSLSAPAQFEVTQRLMTEEEFRQVQKLRERRELIQREMQYVALERTLEVRVAGFPRPHLTEPAARGVLSQLMDDLAHNGNAIRKLGVEPFAIDKAVAEAVEAALAVFLEPGAAE